MHSSFYYPSALCLNFIFFKSASGQSYVQNYYDNSLGVVGIKNFTSSGFLSIADVSSPPVISRHLVLTHLSADGGDSAAAAADDENRTGSLCVFLHGALKVESLCALVQVGRVDAVFY